MSSNIKTLANDNSVEDFINTVDNEVKRQDSLRLLDLFKKVTSKEPMMWGSSIIGFGKYHYKSERSAQEGDWPLVGFSPRKQNLTLYVLSDEGLDLSQQLDKLGKHKTSKACLYINKLDDIDMDTLEEIVRLSYKHAQDTLLTK